jgi:murein DD-endopeptidase MepM/ murein hydrolase activator NlpD
MTRTALALMLTMTLVTLTACGGEVVTPQPTIEERVRPTNTPPPVLEPTLHPTATAPLMPPAATATPTLTATPIIHTVQEGETLGAIAFQYGVSVEAIQAANGIENPQFLQIAQELIIPIGERETDSIPGLLLPTPTPLPLVAQGVAFYETPVGSLWCLGEIANTVDFPLTNVQVRVMLFNASGELLIEANAFTAADVIPPGERSPFGILFTSPPPDWANPQVAIMRGEAAEALAGSYVPITVTESKGEPSGPHFRVSGAVQNASVEQTAGSVIVIATTYDAGGSVTGFRQGTVELEGTLPPGASAPFTLQFGFHGDTVADFDVIAVGRTPSE